MQLISLTLTIITMMILSYHSYKNGDINTASKLFKMALIFPVIYAVLVIILTI